MSTRDEQYTILTVGRKRTGKSTKTAGTVDAYAGDKVLILDVNNSPAYNKYPAIELDQVKALKSGKVKLLGTPDEEALKTIAKYFRGGLLVFEDCTKYISGNVRPEIKTFLVDHRMYNCDLIFTFHSLVMVPPFFWQMASYLRLLKTQDVLENKYRGRIPNFEKVSAAFKRVNASKDPYYFEDIETLI